jgi:uncharacterized coiled-coil DUF342 family protein
VSEGSIPRALGGYSRPAVDHILAQLRAERDELRARLESILASFDEASAERERLVESFTQMRTEREALHDYVRRLEDEIARYRELELTAAERKEGERQRAGELPFEAAAARPEGRHTLPRRS